MEYASRQGGIRSAQLDAQEPAGGATAGEAPTSHGGVRGGAFPLVSPCRACGPDGPAQAHRPVPGTGVGKRHADAVAAVAGGGCAPLAAVLAQSESHARAESLFRNAGGRGAPVRVGRRIRRAPLATHITDLCHGERGRCRVGGKRVGGRGVLKNIGSNWLVTVVTVFA